MHHWYRPWRIIPLSNWTTLVNKSTVAYPTGTALCPSTLRAPEVRARTPAEYPDALRAAREGFGKRGAARIMCRLPYGRMVRFYRPEWRCCYYQARDLTN
jgi:hypothetical protein